MNCSSQVIEVLLRQFAEGRCAELSSECTVMLGRLVSNLITYQKVNQDANNFCLKKSVKLLVFLLLLNFPPLNWSNVIAKVHQWGAFCEVHVFV